MPLEKKGEAVAARMAGRAAAVFFDFICQLLSCDVCSWRSLDKSFMVNKHKNYMRLLHNKSQFK